MMKSKHRALLGWPCSLSRIVNWEQSDYTRGLVVLAS